MLELILDCSSTSFMRQGSLKQEEVINMASTAS